MTTSSAPKRAKKPTKKKPTKKPAPKRSLLPPLVRADDFSHLPRSPLWEVVDEGSVDGRTPVMFTVRAAVPGGWLVAVSMRGLIAPPVFVPDATSSWLRRKAPAPAPVSDVESVIEPKVGLDAMAPPEIETSSTSEASDSADGAGDVTHGGDPGDEAAA